MSQAQAAWAAYSDGLRSLSPTTASEGDQTLEEKAVDDLLARSEALEAALVAHLDDKPTDEQELAALQLQAAAAIDLDQANALVALDEGSTAVDATLGTGSWSELDRILSTPTEQGILAVPGVGGNGFSAALTAGGTLRDEVGATIDAIAADAAKAAGTTAKGLAGVPGRDLARALGEKVDDVFEQIGDAISWLKRKAVAFVLKAVHKLLAVFGTSADALRNKIGDWVADLDEDRATRFLHKLYGVDTLKARYEGRIDAQPIPADRADAARQELAALQAKWHVRAKTIDTIGGIVPLARSWLWGLAPPWGTLAYVAAFGLATGYVVFAGGDYLDWSENDGVLDLADGVGTIVSRAAGV